MKKILMVSSLLAVAAGVVMMGAGIWGICFTYENISKENIVTPDDASMSGVSVRGPFTVKAQADIIREHTLRMTGGKTFAEMPRTVPKTDEAGNMVLDENGNAVMVLNEARNIWITAITLTTALNLAIITYAFSALILFLGMISVWTGFVFYALSRKN